MKNYSGVIRCLSAMVMTVVFSLSLRGTDPAEVNSVLASVDGQAITLMDILPFTRNKELQASSVYSGDKLLDVISGYRKKAVDDLIDNILIVNEFSKYKYELPKQDVEREIDRFAVRIGCRSRSQLEIRLRKEGGSVDEVRMMIRKNMMVQMMLFRQVKIADPVSPREMYEYFDRNRARYTSPEVLTLSMYKLDNSKADYEIREVEICKTLEKDPAAFEALRKKSGNSDSWEVARGELRPEFAAAFKKFAAGEVSKAIRVYDGTVWLRIDSLRQAEKKQFREVEEQIRAELELKNREQVIAGYARKLRAKALIEYFFE